MSDAFYDESSLWRNFWYTYYNISSSFLNNWCILSYDKIKEGEHGISLYNFSWIACYNSGTISIVWFRKSGWYIESILFFKLFIYLIPSLKSILIFSNYALRLISLHIYDNALIKFWLLIKKKEIIEYPISNCSFLCSP